MSLLASVRLSRRFGRTVVVGLALHSLSFAHDVPGAWAQSSQGATEPKRPAYQLGSAGRFNEDWSGLKGVDLSQTGDVWDRLKFIPFTQDERVWLSLGGQLRERVEYFDQFLFGNSAPERSDTYLLSRIRLNADLHVTPYFRAYVEGRSALSSDSDLL